MILSFHADKQKRPDKIANNVRSLIRSLLTSGE